jgi:hypothetical protein
MTWVEEAVSAKAPLSVGLIANAAEALPELVTRGVVPDVVTDQTSAHDPLYGYIPAGLSMEQAAELRKRPGRVPAPLDGIHGPPRAGHAGLEGQGRGGLRLRQQYPPARL